MNTYAPRLVGEKICYTCKDSLPVIHFSDEPRHRDGLSSSCRQCERINRKREPNYKKRLMTPQERLQYRRKFYMDRERL